MKGTGQETASGLLPLTLMETSTLSPVQPDGALMSPLCPCGIQPIENKLCQKKYDLTNQ